MTISSVTSNTGEIKVPQTLRPPVQYFLLLSMLILLIFFSLVRINPLSLMEIILYVARQMKGKDNMMQQEIFLSRMHLSFFSIYKNVFFPDPKDAITFLEKTKEKVRHLTKANAGQHHSNNLQ